MLKTSGFSRFLGVFAYGANSGAAEPARSSTPPRNIVFVLVDDLRYDAMGFVTPGLQTPNIDHLAKNGVYFPMFNALANNEGQRVVPFTERLGPGTINRNRSGPGAAEFPPQWLITPESPNRLHGNFPDSREKLEAEQQGVPYVPKEAQ